MIGSGPGGYAAALTAARRGLRVGLIEREQVGGVCLNVGCIPTKALLSVSGFVRRLKRAGELGVTVRGYEVDYAAVRARAERIVADLRRGLTDLLRREGVELVAGSAAFEQPRRLLITRDGRQQPLEVERVVVATGARPLAGPWTFDERRILSYRGLLALTSLPESLLVVGGGVIGCEFASCFSAFGTRVTIVEQQPQLLSTEDPDAVRWLTRQLEADGVTVHAGTTVERLAASASDVQATLSDGTSLRATYAVIAIGQRPNLDALQLRAASIASSEGGITVDALLRTSQPHIAAIGDCLERHGLAHWASAEGAMAVRGLLGDPPETLDPLEVPRCIFTEPEIAHVGPVAAQAGDQLRLSRFAFGALGKSHCDGETEGWVKLLVDRSTDRVRGATIVGAQASTLIHHAVLAIHQGLTARQLARTITAHPTLPEAISEAAAHLYGESLALAARPSTGAARHAGRSGE